MLTRLTSLLIILKIHFIVTHYYKQNNISLFYQIVRDHQLLK